MRATIPTSRSTPAHRYRRRVARSRTPKEAVGWREWITLPALCPTPIKAKVDTGARTSALHAFRLRLVDQPDGTIVARFVMHPHQRSTADSVTTEAEVIDFRAVRSSNGKLERRPVIRTEVVLGSTSMPLDLTLTQRDAMGFRMLLGRAALRKRFLVDPGRSYLATGKSGPEVS